MSATRRGAFPLPLLKHGAIFVSLFALLAVEIPAQTQPPLSFFKNYFITGDYAVRGVSLWRKGVNGTAVAMIPPLGSLGGTDGVPETADIVAAFLYVQTAESIRGSGIDHATFLDYDLGPYYASGSTLPGSGTFAKPLVAWENAPTPCWSVNVPSGRRLMTYRVDVLRFLPIDPRTKKQDLTKPYEVSVADAGRFFGDDDETCRETKPSPLPRALGASLLVVYRDPEMPLSAVVIYDGAYTKRAFGKMIQPIEGFYQASMDAPAAKMTHIVGDGRPKLSEQVFLGNQSIAKNPYVGGNGTVWDNPTFPNPTFPNLTLPAGAQSTSVTVDRLGLLSDCLTFSAMVFKTTVQDADDDGLVDRWETSPPPLDPNGRALPDLGAMEASPEHKDLFVQIDYMYAAKGTMYGGIAEAIEHTHLPAQNALKTVAEAFAARGVNVHFDVGDHYQEEPLPSYIVPAVHAQVRRDGISETKACAPVEPVTGEPTECAAFDAGIVTDQQDIPGQFPKYPGTVGWKTGFQLMRDEVFRFDPTRKDIFHYALFAHSVGIPKAPCQIELANGDLVSDPDCQNPGSSAYNSEFNVPRTNSGIADFPGGDLLITLGAFRDENQLPIGTQFMQGATLMHELGHNFELTHAGLHVSNAAEREPNCKPNYHSVMNYLYQLRGLPDFAGKVWMDYSAEEISGLDEMNLSDNFLSPTPRYRSGWYAPLANSYLEGLADPASKHCDGSPLLPGEVEMVRVDAASVDAKIDWNADGGLNSAGLPAPAVPGLQDINFDGIFAPPLKAGSNDWATLRLSQLGGRRSTGGYYIDLLGRKAVGPLSLDIGRGDIGRGDIGRGDIGRGDIGRGDIGAAIGRGDIGRGDIGRGDIGRGDIGRGDIGRGDIGRGDIGRGGGDLDVGGPDEPIGDIDLETAKAVAGNAPSPAKELSACLTTGGECTTAGGGMPVRLDWQAPHLDQAVGYSIYRFNYDPAPAAVFPPSTLPTVPVATVYGVNGQAPATTYYDYTAPFDQYLAYFVVAHFSGGVSSGVSDFVRVNIPVAVPTPTMNIVSVTPSTAAAGSGQMVTVKTTGAPTGTPAALFTQGTKTTQGFVFESPSSQNEYFVRLPFPGAETSPGSLEPGQATTVRLIFLNAISQPFPVTVSTTPGTPQARFAIGLGDQVGTGPCDLGAQVEFPITSTVAGRCIAISAYGIDTSRATAVFTQFGTSSEVPSALAISRGDYGLAAVFRVPDALQPGPFTVALKTTVNGTESAPGNLLTLALAETTALLDFPPVAAQLGDLIDRGFYVPDYPGTTLSSVTVWLGTRTAGSYTVSMTARNNDYGGSIIGTSTVTVSLPASTAVPVTFQFPTPAVTRGTPVTFAMRQDAPPRGEFPDLFYDVQGLCGPDDPDRGSCPVSNPTVETEGTRPPLDTTRRYGVSVQVLGIR